MSEYPSIYSRTVSENISAIAPEGKEKARRRKRSGERETQEAAIYARVSTKQQVEEATIESQVAALESYAKEKGYKCGPAYIFLDEGISGSQLDRPALNRMRDIATEGYFSVVLCFSPDRLSRQYALGI